MKTIKLDAIDSTNDFLKNLSKESEVENFTLVTAKFQSKGKGQRGANWSSEKGKNLIMSILINNSSVYFKQIFDLNVFVSIAVFEVLSAYNIPNLTIKWPNDIMSDSKKIGGILIENTFKTDNSISSIIGIGLNCNQTVFENLPKATSLSLQTHLFYDVDKLAEDIRNQIVKNTQLLPNMNSIFWQKYQNILFKKGVPIPFEDSNKQRFMGIIKGVSSSGLIEILLENDKIVSFDLKQIVMLY
jgi:BirA family biotin operon repressor/biotin-[acetyl-CoA-carboxylase] ligase